MCTGTFAKIARLTRCSIASRSSAVSCEPCVKSKRSLSGRTAEPACVDVLAEHLAERRLQEVRRGVVRHRREADAPRDDRPHAVAGREALAAEEQHLVAVEAVRVDELRADRRVVVALDPALVGHLAAARRIERRLAQLREERAVAEILERAELGEDVDLRVADELGREPGRLREVGGALAEPLLPRPARDLAVALHLDAGSRRRRPRGRARARARPSARSGSRRSRRAGMRPPRRCRAPASSSNSFMPRSSVSRKRSSSARTTRSISAAFSTTSGYHGPTCSTTMRGSG